MGIIGISGNIQEPEKRILYQDKSLHLAEASLIETVEKFGHTAVILPVHNNFNHNIDKLISIIDGLILSGGTDVSCELYNETLLNERWKGQIKRDKFEIELLNKAKEKNIPVLGICRGLQLINVAYGGSLYQDIVMYKEGSHPHRNQELYDKLGHNTRVIHDSPLYKLLAKEQIYTNSVHHQGIKELGYNLEIMAYSDDDVIEAIFDPRYDFLWGVQWHPEWLPDDIDQNKIFNKFFDKV